VPTAAQSALILAALTTGRRFGIGGASWSYYAPSSADNITGAASLTLTGTRTLYIVRERLVGPAASAPGVMVGYTRWRLIAPSGTAIASGGVVVSVADTTRAFAIGPLTSTQGYITGIVEPTTVPTSTEVGITDTAGLYILDTAGRYILDTTGV
jgi:hypothetical protein